MLMESKNIRDNIEKRNKIKTKIKKIKNPLLDVKEDISIRPFQRFSFFEKISLTCALIVSIVILIISGFSFFIDLFIKSDYLYTLIDLFIMIMCFGSTYFIISTFRRKIVTDVLIDTAFQEGVYTRLQPLIENIAQAHVDANIFMERLSNMDLKIRSILKEQIARDIKRDFMEESVAVGTSIKFVIKSIFLITVTMAAFMYLLNFNLGGFTSYAVLLIFIMWWGFVTNEYNLWKESSAWAAVFFPILVIPVSVLFLSVMMNYNVLIATLYLFVGLYTFAYYLWAVYAAKGSLPFIVEKKREPIKSEFFALQQKGMLKELFDEFISRIRKKYIKEKKKEYAWKK